MPPALNGAAADKTGMPVMVGFNRRFDPNFQALKSAADAGEIGKAVRIEDALGRYIEYAKSSFPKGLTLEGFRLVVDAGNGAAYKSTPCVLRELGAEVFKSITQGVGNGCRWRYCSTFSHPLHAIAGNLRFGHHVVDLYVRDLGRTWEVIVREGGSQWLPMLVEA